MSSRMLYHDRVAALTDEALALRGFTKIFGRQRRVPLERITSFRLRPASDYPNEQIPAWGLDDRRVWFTRDPRRWRRTAAIEVTLDTEEIVGFSPAHPGRVRDLLVELGVTEQ